MPAKQLLATQEVFPKQREVVMSQAAFSMAFSMPRNLLQRQHVLVSLSTLTCKGGTADELLGFQWPPGRVGAELGLQKRKAGLGLGGPGAV